MRNKALSVLNTGDAVWTPDQIDLITKTVCKGANQDELKLFLYVAEKSGLDPFARQIHAVFRRDSAAGRNVMSIQTGIDGLRLIAQRTKEYAGSDEAVYEEGDKYPQKAIVTVHRMVQGTRVPFVGVARWSEYYPGNGGAGFMWRKMPYLMLGKVAEALALRKGFPSEMSGIYTDEEMSQANTVIEENNELNEKFAPKEKEVEAYVVPKEEPEPEIEEDKKTCEACGEFLVKSHTKPKLYCPNWQDKSVGEHTVRTIKAVEG